MEVIMTNEQKQVYEWMKCFSQECPEKPVIPSLEVRRLRAKLILEEALETVNALGFQCSMTLETGDFMGSIEFQGELKEPNLLEIADGCEDLKVVTEGTLIACGLVNRESGEDGYDPLFDEVMHSNNSKFWCDANDKDNEEIKKHPEYKSIEVAKQNEAIVSFYLVKDKDGKVIKSPSYSPPNLAPIINELAK